MEWWGQGGYQTIKGFLLVVIMIIVIECYLSIDKFDNNNNNNNPPYY